MPNFIEIGQTSLEKSVTKIVYTLQYFGSPGGPPGPRVTSLRQRVHQPPPSSNMGNFVLFGRPFSEISAAKFSRFCCRRDGQTKNIRVNALHAATKILELYALRSVRARVHVDVCRGGVVEQEGAFVVVCVRRRLAAVPDVDAGGGRRRRPRRGGRLRPRRRRRSGVAVVPAAD